MKVFLITKETGHFDSFSSIHRTQHPNLAKAFLSPRSAVEGFDNLLNSVLSADSFEHNSYYSEEEGLCNKTINLFAEQSEEEMAMALAPLFDEDKPVVLNTITLCSDNSMTRSYTILRLYVMEAV